MIRLSTNKQYREQFRDEFLALQSNIDKRAREENEAQVEDDDEAKTKK